jgi:hypothetical protein
LVSGAIDGKIHIFLNEGTENSPDFRSEQFAQADGSDLIVPSGRSSPVVLDVDGDNKKDLVVGNTNGQLLFYSNMGTDAAPDFSGFEYVQADGVDIDLQGTPRSRSFVCYWTDDGLPDVLIGAGDGNVHLYQGVPVTGDFDRDRDVDNDDFTIFQACSTGPSIPYDPGNLPPSCTLVPSGGIIAADFDNDNDVDQNDFAIFQRCYSGMDNPADPNCAS